MAHHLGAPKPWGTTVTASAPKSSSTTHLSASTRRALPIEDVLRWTIRDELPKRRDDKPITAPLGSGMHPMWRGGVFAVPIDNWNREPGMPLAMGDPHPDALRVEAAIKSLRPEDLDLDAYEIGYGLAPHHPADQHRAKIPLAAIVARAKESAVAWIITHAKQGGCPDIGGGPNCEAAMGTRGQATLWLTVSIPGGTGANGEPWFMTSDQKTTPARAGAYRPGTFCKLTWTRDLAAVAEDRATYAAWHAGLAVLARRLTGLDTIAVRPPAAPATPWIEPPQPPTTLRSLLPVSEPLPLSRHPVPRFRARPASPVRHIDPATYPELRQAA